MRVNEAMLRGVLAGLEKAAGPALGGLASWSSAARCLSVASSRLTARCPAAGTHLLSLALEQQHRPPTAAVPMPLSVLQAVRTRHTLTKPLLVQPIDVLQVAQQIEHAQSMEELALPVLQHSHLMQPQQVVLCFTRLPYFVKACSRGPSKLRATAVAALEQLQLPALLSASLAARLQQLLPHCTPQQLATSLWGIATSNAATRSRPHMPSTADAATAEQQAAAPTIHLLPAVRTLVDTVYQQLLQNGLASSMPSASLAAVAWSLSALQPPKQPPPPPQVALLQVIGDRLTQLSPQQTCEQLGWRGVVQLLAAAERARDRARLQSLSPLVSCLTQATSHLLQQHLQAADARPPGAGLLLPRAKYHYRSLEGTRTFDRPLPPKESKYLRSTVPYVQVLDFTPGTLVPCLRAIHLLHPDDARRTAVMQLATQHLLAMLPRHPPQRPGAGKLRPKALSKAESIARAIQVVDPVAASTAVQIQLTARYRRLQPSHAVQLMQILDIERPARARSLASRLLQYISAEARLRTVDALSSLHVAAALRLPHTSHGVSSLMQQLERITLADHCPLVWETTRQLTGQTQDSTASSGLQMSATNIGKGVEASRRQQQAAKDASDKKGHGGDATPAHKRQSQPLGAGQLAGIAASLLHLNVQDTAARNVLLSVVHQAHQLKPSDWDAKSVGMLLAATAHAIPVCFSGVDARSEKQREVMARESQLLFSNLQHWSLQVVPMFGAAGAVWCAAGLACWPEHDPVALKRVARRALQMPADMLPQQAVLLKRYVGSLPSSLRVKLHTVLHKADPEHKLLPYLA